MATIIKSQGAYVSPLANADFSRQRDVLKLARMGNGDMQRLWNGFAQECPANARLVIADVDSERQATAKANGQVDKRLRKAEQLVTKARKPKKAKTVTKAQKAEADFWKFVRPVPRNSPDWAAHQQRMAETAAIMSLANSDNPFEREAARKMLGR